MELTRNLVARSLQSSTLTLPTVAFPARSLAISSMMGEISRQGPHHGAQKSRRTGSSDFRISDSKLESVTVTTFWLAMVRNFATAFRISVLRGVFPLQNRLCGGNVVEEKAGLLRIGSREVQIGQNERPQREQQSDNRQTIYHRV